MIVVDVETGGLDRLTNPLLSLGAVDFNNQKFTFYGKCQPIPGMQITKQALEVNGINIDEWVTNVTPGIMLQAFHKWLGETSNDGVLAGHNPTFDLGFIRVNCARYGLQCPFGHRTVDLHSLVYSQYINAKDDKFTSDRVYDLLNMKTEPKPHIAINGAKWETEAFNRLIFDNSHEDYNAS